MPKLRHIALAAEDPFVAAEFYKQAFDFTEVSRIDKSDDPKKSYGVFLSDGAWRQMFRQAAGRAQGFF